MAITERQLDVARISLAAAGRRYGAALAGGNALNIHEQMIGDGRGIARATRDLDFFVSRQRNVKRAVDAVVAALQRAGYTVDRQDKAGGLADLGFEDATYELAMLVVEYPGDPEQVLVEVAHFDYSGTVNSPIGPVLSLEELGSYKACAFSGRREPRDAIDVAAFIAAGFTPQQLIAGAKERDPGLMDEDYADAALWVDGSNDEIFAPDLAERGQDDGEVRDVAWMRRMLAAWPREPRHRY